MAKLSEEVEVEVQEKKVRPANEIVEEFNNKCANVGLNVDGYNEEALRKKMDILLCGMISKGVVTLDEYIKDGGFIDIYMADQEKFTNRKRA